VTSRAAVVYSHKNETIDVITSKDMQILKLYDYLVIESSCPELTQAEGLNVALRSAKYAFCVNYT